MPRRTFLKIFCEAAIEGAIHAHRADVRGCYWTLLWLVGNEEFSDYGVLAVSIDPFLGYSDEQIAAKLNTDREVWIYAKKLLSMPHGNSRPLIAVLEGNAIAIVHYSQFQPEYRRQKKYRNRDTKELQQRLQQEVTAFIGEKACRRRREEEKKLLGGVTPPVVDKDVDNLVNDLANEKDMNHD